MSRPKLLLLITVLGVISVIAYLLLVTNQRPSQAKVRAITTALLELHDSFSKPGSRALNQAVPINIMDLGSANGVQIGATQASLLWMNELWGFRWSKRFQLSRNTTNETIWTLYKAYSFDTPAFRGPKWQRTVATITNAPTN